MHILIVDDDIVDRESIKRSLSQSTVQCSIEDAIDADSAAEMCRDQHFDIVLLDYSLPKRDGIELLIELRQKSSIDSEVIVMMSNSEDEKLALECIQAGAQDFLLKKEISGAKLGRTILQSQKRFELEQELRKSFERVKQLAERDSLTNLANRYLFDETFKVAVANNQRNHSKLAILVFDVDNFKLVNDSFGHQVGDELLRSICKRLSDILRGDEMFARLGGDEFVILMTNLRSLHDAARVANRIKLCLKKAFFIDGHEVMASVSIGISVYHEGCGSSADEVFRYADIAMYRSKRKGRGNISFFEQGMQEKTQRRLLLENGLSQALEKREFHLCYQPVFNAQSLKLEGFEALIRWQTSQGLISPDEFIPVAEQTLHIVEIGNWVISEAIRQLGIWNGSRTKPLRMAINISAKQLSEDLLATNIEALCVEHNVSPHLLDIELTETALFKSSRESVAVLKSIVDLNCNLALDDFGTGYSSISHLQNTPLTIVKLDKSLMPSGEGDKKTAALLKGLVQMLNALGLTIVAEGIETLEHQQLCQSLGVHRLQGFYYSAGLSPDEITTKYLMHENN